MTAAKTLRWWRSLLSLYQVSTCGVVGQRPGARPQRARAGPRWGRRRTELHGQPRSVPVPPSCRISPYRAVRGSFPSSRCSCCRAALGPRTIHDQRSAADSHGQHHRRSTCLLAGSVTAWTSLTTTRSQVRALSRPPANPAGHSLCDDPGHVLRSRQPRVTLLCLLGRCSGRFLRWNRDCGGGRRGLRPPPSVPPAAAGNDQKVLVDPGHLGASQAAQEGGDGLAQLVW